MSTVHYSSDPDLYDADLQVRALRLILQGSPATGGQAATGLRVADPASRQMRLDRLIPTALDDPAAAWSPHDRTILARAFHGGLTAERGPGGRHEHAEDLDLEDCVPDAHDPTGDHEQVARLIARALSLVQRAADYDEVMADAVEPARAHLADVDQRIRDGRL